MPEIRVSDYSTIFLAETSKTRLFRQNNWYWAEDFLKKVSKKVGLFSKFACFLMIPDESIKCPNLLNKPAIFETFFKKSSAQYPIILPKKPTFTSICQKDCQINSDPDFRHLELLWLWAHKHKQFAQNGFFFLFSSWKVKILCL